LKIPAILMLAFFFTASAYGQAPRGVTIDYTLKISRPISHLYDIEIDILGHRSETVDVAMPAWAPGDYRIRDFARNVQEFSAETTRRVKLAWKQTDKQTWRISKASGDDVVIRYRLYSNDLTDEMADITGPATFMYIVGNTRVPVHLEYDIPSNWKIYSSLEKSGGGYAATDYDTLADSPIFLGNFKVLEFSSSAGVPHRIVFSNPRIALTERQVIEDLRDIVDGSVTLFGAVPYRNYTFLVKVRSGVTGTEMLEHQSSARMTVGENDFGTQAGYRRFIAGASRALVRTWIGKKIHPQYMESLDYSREAYTRMLWFMDGASTYLADILQVRTGFLIPLEFYSKMGTDIDALQHQAGRQLRSLEEASMNAWARSDNTALNTFSYSTKDEIASLMLDMEIRGRTKNQKSLNDVVRYLTATYAAKGIGVPEDGIQNAVAMVAGSDFSAFFDKVVRGRGELEYNSSLQYAGLEVNFHRLESAIYFGVEWERAENNQVRIRRVLPGSPADRAQLDSGDILVALDSDRITSDNMLNRIHSSLVGVPITVTFMRSERLRTTQLTPGESKEDNVSFVETPTAKPEQIQLRNSWLGM